jgi:hypothetical protein
MNRREFLVGAGSVAGSALLARPPLAWSGGASIDRRELVSRHDVIRTASDPGLPVQVGNGRFAFGADITGLQTFVPFATLSDWGWKNDPLPPGEDPSEFGGQVWDTHGRPVRYDIEDPAHPELSEWLRANPNRMNLGRIGLHLLRADGREATEADLADRRQRLDLWTGTLHSRFTLDGAPVEVETTCHPDMDAVAVRIFSPLIEAGRLGVFVDFPYANGKQKFSAPYVGIWDRPDAHVTELRQRGRHRADIAHSLDGTTYQTSLAWRGEGELRRAAGHRYVLTGGDGRRLDLTCLFSPDEPRAAPPAVAVARASADWWPAFWRSGGAIDLSGSADPRWQELERRIVLSQYTLAVNEAGSDPPQESGLVNDGWYGKFHMEMYFWHAAHYALWNRWPLLDRSLDVYERFLPSSRERARDQGYRGARWPKMTDPSGRFGPGQINALLIWQQPHPLLFAELEYRARPGRRTLEKWREIVAETADFMAAYAFREPSGRYVLGPPLHVVSENTDPRTTINPAFELSYWRFGLRVAQTWRRRLGLGPDPRWEDVRRNLAPLPVQDGRYVLYEGVQDMWTTYNHEHPALVGLYGWLPGDGVDLDTMRATAEQVHATWQFDESWGWDFPMLAMNAARLGDGAAAVDFLLHELFQFRDCGLAIGGTKVPPPYFPGPGGLLYAVALMCAGWGEGGGRGEAPGFPSDGRWNVRWEGLSPAI